MADWWQSPLGRHIVSEERALLASFPLYFHGYYQIQIGDCEGLLPSLSGSYVQKTMSPLADFEGRINALPFKSRSIDTLLLPHVLEFSDDPHQVLREVERVLDIDGTVLLFIFNPWSLWGLRRLVSRKKAAPWYGYFFSRTRIKDWLSLLNFEVVETRALLFHPPINNEAWFKRLGFIARWCSRCGGLFSGATLLIAQKRTIPLTPIKHGWRTRSLFPSSLTPKPVSRELLNEKS